MLPTGQSITRKLQVESDALSESRGKELRVAYDLAVTAARLDATKARSRLKSRGSKFSKKESSFLRSKKDIPGAGVGMSFFPKEKKLSKKDVFCRNL